MTRGRGSLLVNEYGSDGIDWIAQWLLGRVGLCVSDVILLIVHHVDYGKQVLAIVVAALPFLQVEGTGSSGVTWRQSWRRRRGRGR